MKTISESINYDVYKCKKLSREKTWGFKIKFNRKKCVSLNVTHTYITVHGINDNSNKPLSEHVGNVIYSVSSVWSIAI